MTHALLVPHAREPTRRRTPSRLEAVEEAPQLGVELHRADPDFERDVATVLENFRLLRQDRRLFISYKRDDSRRIAMQLYEALDRRGKGDVPRALCITRTR